MKFVPPGNIAGQLVILNIKRKIQDIGHDGKLTAGLASCFVGILLWVSPRVFFNRGVSCRWSVSRTGVVLLHYV